MSPNLQAFLDMIAHSEGTSTIPGSDDGYRVIVGSTPSAPKLFASYGDHPRKVIEVRPGLKSSAAGRYQILARYFDAYKKKLSLPDFSPASQDKIAIQLIDECRALPDIEAGRFDEAVFKCRSRWASLPGAGYNQHEHKIADLRLSYELAGGKLQGVAA